MEIVAILERSAGNEVVGEMWQDTKVFPSTAPLVEVLTWARKCQNGNNDIQNFRGCLKLTVSQ